MNRVREIVKASYAHGAHIYGAGSCIAILDSGISPHPDFSGRIVGWHDVLSSTRQPYDDYGHGTHVAGIAAGSGQASRGLYRGIAPRADLVAVKVLNRYGEGTVENICTGIDWVLRNRMRYGINIVNISAGTAKEKQFDESSPLVRKVEELWDAGLVVVVSAAKSLPSAIMAKREIPAPAPPSIASKSPMSSHREAISSAVIIRTSKKFRIRKKAAPPWQLRLSVEASPYF